MSDLFWMVFAVFSFQRERRERPVGPLSRCTFTFEIQLKYVHVLILNEINLFI